MTRISKSLFVAAATVAMSGVAIAQDAPAGEPAPEPAAAPAAAPTGAPAADAAKAGGKGATTLGVDLVGVLPVGDYADVANFALGVFPRVDYGVTDKIKVMARVGLIYNFTKSLGGVTPTIVNVPVLVGVRYNIGASGLFADGELGFNYTHVSVSGASDSNTDFAWHVCGGYQMGKMEYRLGLWYTFSDPNPAIGIVGSAGYNFAAL